MSNQADKVTQGDISADNYIWKSTNIGADKLEIHPTDPEFIPGFFSIGIYGYKPGLNTFRVKLQMCAAALITELPAYYKQTVETWDYYRFPISHPGDSRVEIVVIAETGPLALFVSPSIFYPSPEDHHWSAVRTMQGYYEEEPPLPDAVDLQIASFDHYQEVDPFDGQMKREFVKRPSDRDMDPNTRLRIKRDFTNYESRLVICVDTEDWKYTPQVCYLAVKNLDSMPVSYTVKRREVLEEDLLMPKYIPQYKFFRSMYDEVEGSSVSQMERRRLDVGEKSEFTYGEIEFAHMIPLLELCNIKPGEVFWDLGCGAGKCLLTVSLLYPDLQACNGVEFLPQLFELCNVTLHIEDPPEAMAPIKVVHGDMLQVDWSDADVIFTSSICFPDELIEGMFAKALSLKVGARIMTLKSFPVNDIFEVRHSVRVKMTWGKTGLYILEKVR